MTGQDSQNRFLPETSTSTTTNTKTLPGISSANRNKEENKSYSQPVNPSRGSTTGVIRTVGII